jgi:hypothetical protein
LLPRRFAILAAVAGFATPLNHKKAVALGFCFAAIRIALLEGIAELLVATL